MRKSLTDIIISFCLGILLLVFTFQLPKIPDGAKMYPIVLIVASACLVLVSLVINIKKYKLEIVEDSVEQTSIGGKKAIVIYIIFIGVYILLMDKIGYIVSTYLFTLLSLIYLKVRSKKVLIILPIALTGIIYFVFTSVLHVMLPRAAWLPF